MCSTEVPAHQQSIFIAQWLAFLGLERVCLKQSASLHIFKLADWYWSDVQLTALIALFKNWLRWNSLAHMVRIALNSFFFSFKGQQKSELLCK